MHFEHDKHQYFFEKYLRGEMHDEEKQAFEKKLEEDFELKKSFDFYTKNRDEILKDELEEYEEPIISAPKKPEKLGWLFLALSILGLVLVIDYFINKNYEKSIDEQKKETLIDRIKIFNKQPVNDTKPAKPVKVEDEKNTSKNTKAKPIDTTEPETEDSAEIILLNLDEKLNNLKLQNGNQLLETDIMLFDTVFTSFDENRFYDKYGQLLTSTESLLGDSVVVSLTLKSLMRKSDKTDFMVFVEFWDSPVNFKGYRFSGKKLQLFETQIKFPFYLLHNSFTNEFYLVNGKKKFKLIKDNNFHKFITNVHD